MQTAVREAGEELTGFLGNSKTIKKMLSKYGTYNINYKSKGYNTYRCHIFPINSEDHCVFECLPFYYNNNQQFLQKRLPNKIIRDTKIFEKVEIKWFSFNDMKTHHKEFRSFYQNIVHLILGNRTAIEDFVFGSLVNKYNNKNKKLFTKKRRTNKKITRKTY
jgi:hypothetical protein